jgi:processive 1,2-diacylglycerol beta-glucosyltransferase
MKLCKANLLFFFCLLPLVFFAYKNGYWQRHYSGGLSSIPTMHKYHFTGKKKVIIFVSRGGSAHTCAANAMKEYLGDGYDVSIINIIGEVLAPLDPVRRLTFKRYTGEDVYNYFLSHGWSGAVNKLASYGADRFKRLKKRMVNLIDLRVEQEAPDLIISDLMYVNGAVLEVAEKRNIPFMTVSLDFDMTLWVKGLSSPTYKKYRHTFIIDDEKVEQTALKANLAPFQKVVAGFPIRPQFFETKDVGAIKTKFGIPQGKPVIMVMMGGAGSQASYTYAKELAKIDMPKHVIICLGRNEQLKKKVEAIKLNDNTTMTILGFTDRISDLMAASDLLITKPGPSSIVEALSVKLPLLLDGTNKNVRWEEFNIDLIKEKELGDVVRSMKELPDLLEKYLNDKQNYYSLKARLHNFSLNHFEPIFLKLVQELLTIK